MIQIEALKIVELRGIRELKLHPKRQNFLVSGPNGSGKSGVVDAIQFGLTGEISRLSGKGTGGLTVQRHGPHVDRRDDPAAAEVSLALFFPELNKSAVLTRNVKTAAAYTLVPDEPELRKLLDDLARHPELTLSRRDIIKYILVEAGQRSKEIQALLKLDYIGTLRSVLQTARNRVVASATNAQRDRTNAADALRRHLDAKSLTSEDMLAAVNPKRERLGLQPIAQLEANTAVNAGAGEGPHQAFNRATALKDVAALRDALTAAPSAVAAAIAAMKTDIARLEAEPGLLDRIRRRSFVEAGLGLVDSEFCPLCDRAWDDIDHLKAHLRAKLAQSAAAEALQKRLLQNATRLAGEAQRLVAIGRTVQQLAVTDGPDGLSAALVSWCEGLVGFAGGLSSVDDVLTRKDRVRGEWIEAPAGIADSLDALEKSAQARPDQSEAAAAQSYLTLAQDRLNNYRQMRRAEKRVKLAAEAGKAVYSTYCDVAEKQLGKLYEAVESDFSTFYKEINGDDEKQFKAAFAPAEGKLDLKVAFYDKGMFPPGAYHSEGHQDGMGVCLYLALMSRLWGERFSLAVLDDVVMSVDQDHRKEFCRLLKKRFPKTQFIITTHDKVWSKQMQTEGLVAARSGVAFQSWSVQAGPVFEELTGIWDEIDADLAKDNIAEAAGRLRRHMEYVSGELADLLVARPPYRADNSYDLGDLLSAVIGRHGELLKLGAKSAADWKDADGATRVEAMKTGRTAALGKHNGEQWVVNKAVHYNDWATFTKAEFREVVAAFRDLLDLFRCTSPGCDSWMAVSPRKGDAEALRCRCMGINVNLTCK